MASKEKTQIILAAKDETGKAFASAQGNAKGLDKGLGNIAKKSALVVTAFAAIGIAAAAAFAAATNAAINAADNIAKTADAIGISTDALQEYRVVGERAGIATEQLDKGIQGFIVRLGELRAGQGTLNTFLGRTNAEFAAQLKAANSTDDALSVYLKKLASITNASDRAAFSAAAFGSRLGPKMALLVKDGSDSIEVARQRVRDLGQVIEERLLRDAERARDAIDDLSKTISANFTTALLENAEEIKTSADQLLKWSVAALKALGFLAPSKQERIKELTAKIEKQSDALEEVRMRWAIALEKGRIGLSLGARVEFLSGKLETLKKQLQDLETSEPLIVPIRKAPPVPLVSPEEEKRLLAEADATYKFFLQERTAADKARVEEIRARFAERDALDRERALNTRELAVQDMDEMFNAREEHEIRMAEMVKRFQQRTREEEMANQAAILAMWESGWRGKMEVAGSVIGQFGVLMESENRRLFQAGKAAAIASTIISTISAAMKQFDAFSFFPPLAYAAAAAALAAGFIQVQKIRSVKFGGGGGGASGRVGGGPPSVGGGGAAVQNVPATPAQQQLPAPVVRQIDITIGGEGRIGKDELRDLISDINEQVGDGVELVASVVR